MEVVGKFPNEAVTTQSLSNKSTAGEAALRHCRGRAEFQPV